jgi:transposase-like protein
VRAANKQDARAEQPRGSGADADKARIRELEKELARTEEELEILGKALAFFARRADQ